MGSLDTLEEQVVRAMMSIPASALPVRGAAVLHGCAIDITEGIDRNTCFSTDGICVRMEHDQPTWTTYHPIVARQSVRTDNLWCHGLHRKREGLGVACPVRPCARCPPVRVYVTSLGMILRV
jgi:hypothetical protein